MNNTKNQNNTKNTPKINCNGHCRTCKQKTIKYGIDRGHYTYYCYTCEKYIDSKDVIAENTPNRNKRLLTKNIPLIIWNAINKEMTKTNGSVIGGDTVIDNNNAFCYDFENKEVKGRIILDITTKTDSKLI